MWDQYEILKPIGEGSSGTVYQANQRLLNRIVALKLLSPSVIFDETSLARFQKEAKIASSLKHPNIAKVYSFGLTPEKAPYLAMEFLEGRTLSSLIKDKGKLPIESFSNIFYQVCDAIDYAHNNGIIHRDLKPENIMLVRMDDGIEEKVKILDFGIAKKLDDQSQTNGLTKTGIVIGTPLYMSPEQCLGELCDRRSDIYSLGCTMYEALCGSPPFAGDTAAMLMMKHMNDKPRNFAAIDPQLNLAPKLEKLVFRCLEKKPELRPQSVAEIAEIILAARDETPVRPRSSSEGVRVLLIPAIKIAISFICICILALSAATTYQNIQIANTAKKHAEQQAAIEAEWKNIDALLEEAQNLSLQDRSIESRLSYQKIIYKIEKLPPEEQNSNKSSEILYSAYEGLAKLVSRTGGAPESYLDCMKKAIKYADKRFGARSEIALKLRYDLALNLAASKTLPKDALLMAKDLAEKRQANLDELIKRIGDNTFVLKSRNSALCQAAGRLGAAMSILGLQESNTGNDLEAIKTLKKALEILRSASGDNDSQTIWAMFRLCCALEKCKKFRELDEVLKELVIRLDMGASEPPPAERQFMLHTLINLCKSLKDFQREKMLINALIQMSENDYGEKAEQTIKAKLLLKE